MMTGVQSAVDARSVTDDTAEIPIWRHCWIAGSPDAPGSRSTWLIACRRSGSGRARRGSRRPPSEEPRAPGSSAGSAARTRFRQPKHGRSSRAVPSRGSAGAPNGREPPSRAAPRGRARRETCSPRRGPDGSASAGSSRERLVASAVSARSAVATSAASDEGDAKCSRAAHADTVAAIDEMRHGPFGANSRSRVLFLCTGFDQAHLRQNGTRCPSAANRSNRR